MAFKIQMPKEMKIRLMANIAAIVIAFLDAGYSAWYLALVLNQAILTSAGSIFILFPIMSVAGAGLYFLMAKTMWALQKKTKQMGKIVLVLVAVLGILGSIVPVMTAIMRDSDFTTAWYWSVLVGFTSGLGFLIVAAKMIGEMIEKLKNIIYGGFAALAGLVVVIVLANFLANYSDAVQVAALGAMIATIAGVVFTILGYWAETVLIKKKFLVYS
ncbi:MAG TPA: hypothetical protein VKM55_21510 [Candidatus Lokiarchaeia archaeon]|nr:hypothetical protein [Candidatus Lokiarchaeia archaeon]